MLKDLKKIIKRGKSYLGIVLGVAIVGYYKDAPEIRDYAILNFIDLGKGKGFQFNGRKNHIRIKNCFVECLYFCDENSPFYNFIKSLE